MARDDLVRVVSCCARAISSLEMRKIGKEKKKEERKKKAIDE